MLYAILAIVLTNLILILFVDEVSGRNFRVLGEKIEKLKKSI